MTQVAILIAAEVWEETQARLQRLEEREQQRDQPQNDTVLTVRQAATHLNVAEESVRRARRSGRLKGFKINEKEYGFYQYEVNRYKNRYQRT